jgi:hypothetical protein
MSPVLVRQSVILEDQRTKTEYGAFTVSFATGDLFKETLGERDLIIDNWDEVRALGCISRLEFHAILRIAECSPGATGISPPPNMSAGCPL